MLITSRVVYLCVNEWVDESVSLSPKSPFVCQDSGAKPTDSIYLHQVLAHPILFLSLDESRLLPQSPCRFSDSLLATFYAGARCVVESSSTLQHPFTESSRERTTFSQQIRTHRCPPWSTSPSRRSGSSWTSQVSRYEYSSRSASTDSVVANIRNMVRTHRTCSILTNPLTTIVECHCPRRPREVYSY